MLASFSFRHCFGLKADQFYRVARGALKKPGRYGPAGFSVSCSAFCWYYDPVSPDLCRLLNCSLLPSKRKRNSLQPIGCIPFTCRYAVTFRFIPFDFITLIDISVQFYWIQRNKKPRRCCGAYILRIFSIRLCCSITSPADGITRIECKPLHCFNMLHLSGHVINCLSMQNWNYFFDRANFFLDFFKIFFLRCPPE